MADIADNLNNCEEFAVTARSLRDLEDLIERFEENERRTKADTQKKKNAQEMRKKVMKRFGETRKRKEQDKYDTEDKIEGLV